MSYTPNPNAEFVVEKTAARARLMETYLGPEVSAALPPVTMMEEKPVHVTMAYLMAAGRTRGEIAQVTSLSLASISNIVRQPFFIARLKAITEESGKDMVKQFLQGEVLPSLETLRTIRDDPDAKHQSRIAASNSLLDRFLGKPMVHVDSKTELNIHTAAETVDQVERELNTINDELSARGVKLSTGKN